jgi:hypothetical protein
VHGSGNGSLLNRSLPAPGLEPRVRRVGVVMPGLLLQMRPSSGEAPCGGVVASPGENLPRDLLLLGLLERRVGGAPAMGRIGGGRFDKSSVQGRAKREGTGRSLPPHVVVTGGGRNQNPNDAPPRKRRGAGIGAMRGRGGRVIEYRT